MNPILSRTDLEDLRGASRMAFEAAAGLGDVVEHMHTTIQQRPGVLGEAHMTTARGNAGLVYRSVRRGIRLIGVGVDALLGVVAEKLPEGKRAKGREAVVAVINGIYGDFLVRTGNPLASAMSFRYHGRPIDIDHPAPDLRKAEAPRPGSRLLVLVHGLCMNDLQWRRKGHDHGAALAREFGYSPLYLRYNSGLRIPENGRQLAQMLERLVQNWPVPVQELSILAHSMGGLVARSACAWGRQNGHAWLSALENLIFLGTPHMGSPIERGANWLDFVLELSPYSAPLTRAGKLRSAGIQDLRYGTIAEGGQSTSLPTGVQCYTMAATLARRPSLLADHLIGDGLVPLNSALGRHLDRSKALRFPEPHQWIAYETGHLDLLCQQACYGQLRLWLRR